MSNEVNTDEELTVSNSTQGITASYHMYQPNSTTAPTWQTTAGWEQLSIEGYLTRDDFKECVVCTSDCEFVICDVCKVAVTQLRDKVLEAIGRSIEEDLS